jgi:hypothetical protein
MRQVWARDNPPAPRRASRGSPVFAGEASPDLERIAGGAETRWRFIIAAAGRQYATHLPLFIARVWPYGATIVQSGYVRMRTQ